MDDSSSYVGKQLSAGITFLDSDGRVLEMRQLHGFITGITTAGIILKQSNGEDFSLPPDLQSLRPASPGRYTLRATGEVVSDPDFVSSWTVSASPKAGHGLSG